MTEYFRTEDQIRDYIDQYLRGTFTEDQIREIVDLCLRGTFWSRLFNFSPQFDIKQEYGIQIGSYRGRADLVLLVDEKPLVIVECKSQGVIAQGPDQLKSYLCASPAQLGIFANSPNPDDWTYLEKIGCNDFVKIDFDTFKKRFWEVDEERKARTERYINTIAKERAKQLVTPSAIEARTKELIEAEARNHVTNSSIEARTKEITERKAREQITPSAIQARTKAIIQVEARQRVTESAIQARVKVMTKALIEAEAKQRVTESAIQARTKEMIESKARNHVTNSAIEARAWEITERKARERITPSAIRARTDGIIQVEARQRVTESAIQGAVANEQTNQLKSKIGAQQHEITNLTYQIKILKRQTNTLRDQRSNARWGAICGWCAFLGGILAGVMSLYL